MLLLWIQNNNTSRVDVTGVIMKKIIICLTLFLSSCGSLLSSEEIKVKKTYGELLWGNEFNEIITKVKLRKKTTYPSGINYNYITKAEEDITEMTVFLTSIAPDEIPNYETKDGDAYTVYYLNTQSGLEYTFSTLEGGNVLYTNDKYYKIEKKPILNKMYRISYSMEPGVIPIYLKEDGVETVYAREKLIELEFVDYYEEYKKRVIKTFESSLFELIVFEDDVFSLKTIECSEPKTYKLIKGAF